jgi:hypothetical protein
MTAKLVTFTWECRFCHSLHTGEGIEGLCPAQGVCERCSAAYEAKVRANFVLAPALDRIARATAALPEAQYRQKLADWKLLAKSVPYIRQRLEYEAMIALARQVRAGQAEPAQTKKGKW